MPTTIFQPPPPQPPVVTASSGESVKLKKSALKDEFLKEERKNGLVERLFNFLKNKSNIGVGSKKINNSIKEFENGKKTEDEVSKEIQQYRISQKTSQQVTGDVVSSVAAMSAFSFVNNFLKKNAASKELGGNMITHFFEMAKESNAPKTLKTILNFFGEISKTKRLSFAVGASVLVGAILKKDLLKLNRLGSKEFKSEKGKDEQTKAERKAEKKALKKARKKENRKNFFTGAFNGILAPIAGLAGGIAGIPLFLAANIGTRYLVNQKGEEKRSVNDFVQKVKDNALITGAGAALIAVPLYRKASFNKVLGANLEKTVSKLKDKVLTPAFESSKSAYKQLEEILLGSEKITAIINQRGATDADKIKLLSQENLFAAKFLQISNRYYSLSEALRENCPPTRTISEAADFIKNTFGEKYSVSKLLGVGTVAETYLAKEAATGKEVCIKILKEGINAEKIAADKNKMVELLKSTIPDGKEQDYLIKNIDDLASGIIKEVDLANEMSAAQNLSKYTKKANVVNPIEVKDNIYVMEKAPGVSLKTLQEVSRLEASKVRLLSDIDKGYIKKDFAQNRIAEIDQQIAKIKEKSPDFGELQLTASQIDKVLSEYIKVQIEQFQSIHKNGKSIHADIHSGNVFVDLNALRTKKGKVLTLIDTGNTIDVTKQQSHDFMKLSSYIKGGNVKDISSYVMEDALLPDKMTKEAAKELMETELKKIFFDSETALEYMNNDSLLELTANIMRKHDILPGGTQLNLEKAKVSSFKSFQSVLDSLVNTKYAKAEMNAATSLMLFKDITNWVRRMQTAKTIEDCKNVTQYSLKELIRNFRNPNMLKRNSEELLSYELKQGVPKNLDNLIH